MTGAITGLKVIATAVFWRNVKNRTLVLIYRSLVTKSVWQVRWSILKSMGRELSSGAFWKARWVGIKESARSIARFSKESWKNAGPALKGFFSLKTRKDRRLWSYSLGIFGIGIIVALLVFFVQPFAGANQRLKDLMLSGSVPAPNIVIVAYNDDTIAAKGTMGTWSRELHGQAIQNLRDAEAVVVGFDVLFSTVAPGDGVMKTKMDDAGNVVLALVGDISDPSQIDTSEQVVEYPALYTPLADYTAAAVALGHANVFEDGDLIVRRMPLNIKVTGDDTKYVSLSAAMLESASFVQSDDVKVDGSGYMYINYAGGRNTFPRISYKDVIDNTFDPALVRNKVILIGTTATGEDVLKTPVGTMPGVEVHANAVNTIMTGRYLTDSGQTGSLAVILVSAFLCGLFLPRVSIKKGTILTGVLIGAFIAAVIICADKGYMLDPLYSPVAIAVLFVGMVITKVAMERADRRQVTGLFGKYVSDEVASEIIDMADRGVLGISGENREVTVFFADLRGFTKLSSGLEPPQVVDLLNSCFEVMIDLIQANDGMINKFVGDNIMAIWNAPQNQPKQAYLAVKAAIECQKAMAEVNEVATDIGPLEWGIGINTGIATAGSIGSKGRLEYTVIGDTVNLASRFCGGAPGGKVWIGPQTYERVKDKVKATALTPQSFKGKEEAIVVYDVEDIE
ncbi:CHASE2 domain-containing protein [Chloroflexota bacterium]